MNRCRICGRSFDPLGFQVLVPGLSEGFDRVECAEKARAALPAAAAAPPAAVVRPFPGPPAVAAAAAAAPAAVAAVRRPLLVGANLSVLAAGAAATAFLWLRVFGADPLTPVDPGTSAAQAFERKTVPAVIDTGPGETVGEPPQPGTRSGEQEPGAGSARGGPILVAEIPPGGDEDGGDAVGPGDPRPGGGGGGQEPEPPSNPPPPPTGDHDDDDEDDEDDGDDHEDDEDDEESAKKPGEDEDEDEKDTEDDDD